MAFESITLFVISLGSKSIAKCAIGLGCHLCPKSIWLFAIGLSFGYFSKTHTTINVALWVWASAEKFFTKIHTKTDWAFSNRFHKIDHKMHNWFCYDFLHFWFRKISLSRSFWALVGSEQMSGSKDMTILSWDVYTHYSTHFLMGVFVQVHLGSYVGLKTFLWSNLGLWGSPRVVTQYPFGFIPDLPFGLEHGDLAIPWRLSLALLGLFSWYALTCNTWTSSLSCWWYPH